MNLQQKKDFIYKIMCEKYGKDKIDKHFKPYLPMIKDNSNKDPYEVVNRIYDYLIEKNLLQSNKELVKELRFLAAIAQHPKFWETDDMPEGFTLFMSRIDHDFNEPPGTNLLEMIRVIVKTGCATMCEKDSPNILKPFIPLIAESRRKQDKQEFKEIIKSVQEAKHIKERGMLN